jgi:hypothetical protein
MAYFFLTSVFSHLIANKELLQVNKLISDETRASQDLPIDERQ